MEPSPKVRDPSHSALVAWLLASAVIGAVCFIVGLEVGARRALPAATPLASTPLAPAPSVASAVVPEVAPARPAPLPPPNPSSDRAPSAIDIALEDEAKARKMLEPRVWSGHATVDEVKMLRAICRHQKDNACISRATGILAEMTKN